MSRPFFMALALVALLVAAPALRAGDTVWIDVRSPEEFSSNHVSVAVNIPYTEIDRRIAEVTRKKDDLIYLYCRSGRRSAIAKAMLEDIGYRNVVDLGGFEDARRQAVELNVCPEADPADC